MIKYVKMHGHASSAQWKERAFNIFTYTLVGFVIISGISLIWDTIWSNHTKNGSSVQLKKLDFGLFYILIRFGHTKNGYTQRFTTDLNKIRKITLQPDADEAQPRDVNCTFWDCVNIYRCGHGTERLTVFVYPLQEFVTKINGDTITAAVLTQEYYDILEAVYQSPYYTSNPNEACLFLPSIDLLNQHLVTPQLASRALATLEYWDKGENHLIFNMLPGSYPHFNRTIDVNTDRAIILGGGFDTWTYRAGFDISLPVWSTALRNFDQSQIVADFQRKYLLVIGQLNLLPHQLHAIQNIAQDNPTEVLLLESCTAATEILYCKEYSRNVQHKYPVILSSGTFCLIGRSVRLGQPDLLEILAYNCIPVLAIDTYIPPFADVIDWNLAAIQIRERDMHSLMERLKVISSIKILELQQQGRWLFKRYFRDLRTITMTALEVLDGRMFPHRVRNLRQWNTADANYKIPLNPLFLPIIAPKTQGFTAVILTYDRVESLFTLIQKLSLVPSLQCILVIWNNQHKTPPHISTFPMIMKPIKIIQTHANKLSNRFFPYAEIETEAILTIDDDIIMLTADELDFGFEVWREFPDRIVGFPSRIHVWDNTTMRWHYESEWTNQISMVLTGAAFHHKFWSHMYTYAMPGDIKDWVDERMNCEDIAMNFLVANITNKPPIKVTPRKKFKCPECINNEMLSADLNHMRERSACIDRFARVYGHMPLRSVEFRADPVLFKDNFPEKLKRFNDVGAL